MYKNFILCLVCVFMMIGLNACKPDAIEYNSNSGFNGSRDSSTQLLIDNVMSETIDAAIGNNEDWYYVMVQQDGFITASVLFDNPSGIVGTLTIYDGFGRPIETETLNHPSQNIHTLPRIEVKPSENDRYFVAIKVTEGKSTYSIEAKFELPPEPEVAPVIVENTPKPTPKSSCVPADKCKSGQNCCKEKDKPAPENVKIVQGSIVVSTPREGGIIDIRISGLGTKNGIKVGMKATLHGLNRKVELYSCKASTCNGTVKATTEELSRYGTVDVVVE
ncbi:MAG: hypothetical protein IIY06_00555 [Proteobacteria bacterium]|jgi:hypothetical protein|nr:hypothetical protein [Pseudomonadota bacterium]